MASGSFRPDQEREGKVRFPIAAKLVLIISILVLISLGTITALVTFYVSEDVRITAEENNRTVNTRSATAAEAELSTIRANVFLLLDMMNAAGSSGALARQASAFFFERNQNIAAILLSSAAGNTGESEYINNWFFLANELDGDAGSSIDRDVTVCPACVSRPARVSRSASSPASNSVLPVPEKYTRRKFIDKFL